MKKELQDKLYEKYPKIFKQKDDNMKVTCMCWGIECGDGWYDLLDELCSNLQNFIDENKITQIEATQVKEKYGTLRFYTNGYYEETKKFISKAEAKSAETCEVCGKKGKVNDGMWLRCRCKECEVK